MSVHINLSQHATELKAAYKSVIDKDSSVNWILLGYAKGTNDLKVVGSGEGGLDELCEEFEDDKVLFAFTRVVDPNSNLPKYVFISWCGEGAPVQRKGLLPSHLNDVQKFLSGYHVQINARDSEDVSPEHIMKKIEEGSGAKYSYHDQIRSKPPVPQPSTKATTPPSLPEYKRPVQNLPSKEKVSTPPVSSFKPPPASQSLQERFLRQVEQSDKEKTDREKQEQFEKEFLARSKSSNKNGGYLPSSRNQNAREREEQELRERMERARLNRIQNPDKNQGQEEEAEAKKAEAERQSLKYERELAEREEKRKLDLLKEQERVEAEKMRQEQEELERRQQEIRESEKLQQEADSIEKERLQQEEADRIQIEKLQLEEAEKIQMEKLQQEEAERVHAERQELERRQQEETAAQLAQEKLQQERLKEEETQLAREKQDQEDREREELVALQAQEAEQLKYSTEPIQESGSATVLTAIALFDYTAADETEISLKEGEMVVNIVQIDEGWWQGVNESGQEGIFPANYVELVDNPPPSQESSGQEASAPPTEESASTTSYAIALYDYQATEEGELSFAAADKITNIEFLSDDWWQGANPLGDQGLFPANYVELQQ